MPHKEKLLTLLDDFGVPYGIEVDEGEKLYKILIKEEYDSTKITGFPGFFTEFCFSFDGDFVSIGAWE